MLTHLTIANIVWPALYLLGRLISFLVIMSGLFIEFFFVWRLTTLNWKQSIWADVAVNAASALLGLILIPVTGFIVVIPFPVTFGISSWIATFCVAVLINASIESLVLQRGFKQDVGKKEFWLLCFANALSVGVAFGSFWIYPIQD
jgi:uncharacterized membrane protein